MKRKIIILLIILANIMFSTCSGQQKIDVTYIANEGFLIESSGKKVIIDALFNNGWDNYLIPTDSIVSDIESQQGPFSNANLMLVTHNHGDHFNPSMVVRYLINSPDNFLIAPLKVFNEVSRHPDFAKFESQIVKLDTSNQKNNDTTIQGIRVRSFFIQHDSRPQIENVGYLIDIDKLKVFHSGDYNGSELVEFEKLQLQDEFIDLAFLNFYGFWNTTEEREFTEQHINPKKIALMHIPPTEIANVKDSVSAIDDFVHITVFESSMTRKSFVFE